AQYPNAIMVHTPVHASWLNQVESTSPLCNGKCSRPTTSLTSMPLPTSCPRSRPATTRSHDHSNGNAPPPTSTTSSPGSTASPHNPEQHDPDELTIETT